MVYSSFISYEHAASVTMDCSHQTFLSMGKMPFILMITWTTTVSSIVGLSTFQNESRNVRIDMGAFPTRADTALSIYVIEVKEFEGASV